MGKSDFTSATRRDSLRLQHPSFSALVVVMSDTLKITLLGTGIPNPDVNAFDTSTLIEAGDEVVMLDFGRGAVIRLAQAGYPLGYVDTIIISHYHSDHFSGLFDLAMTGTIQQPFSNRGGQLHIFGPWGIDDIAEGAWQATKPDRDIRVADHEIDPEHMRIIRYSCEQEGVVYDRGGLRIIAIEVDHGEFIRPAYAFRVEYGGHVFVHSHDTRYNENLIAQAQGVDVFIHEIAAADTWLGGSPDPSQEADDLGTNALVVRTSRGQDLMERALQAGFLTLTREVNPRYMDSVQPHQRNKKYAVSARHDGLRAEGKTVPRTARLRPDALHADLDPSIARSQYDGTRARVSAGKASEAAPRSLVGR
ncbi:MAG: hypothetical protein CME02_11630 [Geminicoccus sp.]|nr:hypothetical protein [Geminicoccus sp.]